MARIGLILSGCGFQDGAEIHESVVAMLCLQEAGAEVICMAPQKKQVQVTNHLTGSTQQGARDVIVEAARIARGQIDEIGARSAADLDGLVLPGGYGVALNLCTFAAEGQGMAVDPGVERLVKEINAARKPIGAICISPIILAKCLGAKGVCLTIGNDPEVSAACESWGAKHQQCRPEDCVIDERNRVATTPAYMLAENVAQIHPGIRKMVDAVIKMAI